MRQRGFSILELIIALALFMMVLAMLGSYASFSLAKMASGQAFIEAEALNQEGQAIVELVARRDWSSVNSSINALGYSAGEWQLLSAPPEQIGVYQRKLDLSPVCRDAGQLLVDCSAGVIDPNTYLLGVVIDWSDWLGAHEVRHETYIANWR